jgi:hypothetical protein
MRNSSGRKTAPRSILGQSPEQGGRAFFARFVCKTIDAFFAAKGCSLLKVNGRSTIDSMI